MKTKIISENIDYSRENAPKDIRCAYSIITGGCTKDCLADEYCRDYVPMWYSTSTQEETIDDYFKRQKLRLEKLNQIERR